jgi:hypothetical protein
MAFWLAPTDGHPYITVMWNSRLRRPLHLTDGRVLKTLEDARAFIGSLPERDRQYDRWISLSALLLSAAQSDNPAMVAIVTNKLSDALRSAPHTVTRLDETEKRPSASSVQRRSKTTSGKRAAKGVH